VCASLTLALVQRRRRVKAIAGNHSKRACVPTRRVLRADIGRDRDTRAAAGRETHTAEFGNRNNRGVAHGFGEALMAGSGDKSTKKRSTTV
jgi:hypothetical protein